MVGEQVVQAELPGEEKRLEQVAMVEVVKIKDKLDRAQLLVVEVEVGEQMVGTVAEPLLLI
jgi:hypothetical protein